MSLDPQLREAIDMLLRDNRVVLFMKGNRIQPQCGFSAKAVATLDMLLPEYVTIDVLQYPEIREGIKLYGNWPTVPQLYVEGELLGGSDIILEMHASGELAEVLGIAVPEVTDDLAIEIEPAARDVIRSALADHAGQAIHLKIDAGWGHQVSLAPPDALSLRVSSGDVEILIDPWSAGRARGLRIGLKEQLAGTGFSFANPNAPPPVRSLAVTELKAWMDRGEDFHLFDVRSEEERAHAALPGARPWEPETLRFIDTLPRDASLVFMCHKGGRSRAAAESFRRKGYLRVYNLEGGIDAWSAEIDATLPRY